MPRRSLRTGTIALAVGLLSALAATRSVHATPPRGPLEGRTLAAADEVRDGLGSLAGSLLGGDVQGQVLRAVVEEDSPRRLAVRVTHEGLQGARLWGELLTADRRRQAGIVMGEPVTIQDASGELVVTFEPEPGAEPAASALLRISVAAPTRRTASLTRSFRLGKEWSRPAASGADFVVTIAPRPVGRTAELGPTPSSVVPTSVVRIAPPPPAPAAAAVRFATIGTLVRTPQPAPVTRSVLKGTTARALPSPKLLTGHAITTGIPPADAARGARGPAALPLPAFADVRTEDIRLDLTRVLNVHPSVYQDQEPSSGIFYFLPHDYALEWSEAGGYEFKTVYSAAATGGAAGEVLMAARLEGGIGPRELEVAAKLVQSYAQRNNLVFRELRPLPIDSLAISIADDLGRYDVPTDRISIQGLTDVTGRLDVSWVTDERTKDFIQEALIENVGISGSVTYAPTGAGLGPRSVPIHLRLADYATFGPFRWDRTGWKNPTPYPITLRYLHALRLTPGAPAVVNSWSLGETRVPPGGQVRWSAASVPFWVDTQAQRMWIDYTVDASCKECGIEAIAGLTGGVSAAGSSQITLRSLDPLAATGAQRVLVEVRSRYFDPKGEQTRVRTVVVDADDKDFQVGPFFGAEGASGRTGPLFEIRLSLSMPSGKVVSGVGGWVPSEKAWMPIGRDQLGQSIGPLSGP